MRFVIPVLAIAGTLGFGSATFHSVRRAAKRIRTGKTMELSFAGQPKWMFLILAPLFSFAVSAQTPTVIPLASEPHHHLALHNQYVNVYQVEVAPHDSVLLHRHDFDAISVMLDDAQVIVRAPGKPEAPQRLSGRQVRLQPSGYVHATYIDGDKTYRNVTVELLLPQQNEHNLCAPVIAGQALDCPKPPAPSSAAKQVDQPQFETDQTAITLTRVLPHQSIPLDSSSRYVLIIALDEAVVSSAIGRPAEQFLHPGELVWLVRGGAVRVFKNNSDKEARFVSFALTPLGPHDTQSLR